MSPEGPTIVQETENTRIEKKEKVESRKGTKVQMQIPKRARPEEEEEEIKPSVEVTADNPKKRKEKKKKISKHREESKKN